MSTVAIPKTITKGEDLLVVRRREYEKAMYLLRTISIEQAWFWTKEWQNKEKEADLDIHSGRISGFYGNKKKLKKALQKFKTRH